MKTINVILFTILSYFFISQNGFAEIRPGQTVYIQSKLQSNRYLAPKDGSWSNKAYVSIHSKARASDRACQWKLEDAGGGFYYFAMSNGKVMDIKLANRDRRTSVWTYPKNRTDAQKFRLVDAGSGYHYIVPKINTALRLDVKNAGRNEGTEIWTYTQNNGDAQKWKFIEVATTGSSGEKSINKSVFASIANTILKKMKIRLNNHGVRHRDRNDDVSWYKKNDSYIEFEGNFQRFDIPEYTRGVRDKKSYLMDMNLSSAVTRFEGNTLVLSLRFEERLPEIKSYCSNCAKFREDNASPDYQFLNNLWKIKLNVIPYGGSVAYDVESVKFMGEIDGAGFGEFWEPIVKDCLIPIMERNIKSSLEAQRDMIAHLVKTKAATLGLDLEDITGVRYVGNDIIFRQR